jgi:two-component system response regulator DevR
MSASPIKILLVDDHFIVRMGLASSLNEETDLRVVGEASTVAEAATAAAAQPPDLAVIDMRLPDGEGSDVVRHLAESLPGVRCLMLSVNIGENDILRAFKAGACGYLPKSVERTELLEAIRAIARGETYFPANVRRVLDVGRARPDLSPRENEVLLLVVEGLLNKEIADRLGLAEITVKQHVSAILRKLGVQDRTQAAIAAVERGLVRLDR